MSPEEVEEPIITGQNERNRAFWGEKKGEYTNQLLESIYEYLIDNKYPDKILVKETKIERDSLKNAFRKIVKRDLRYKQDVNDLNKNIKWNKKENRKYKLLRNWNYIKKNDDKNS